MLHNGHMQTMVSEGDVASAVAIAGNKIVYVGDDSGIDAFVGDNTQVINLDGKFVSPGFIDGHIHAPGNWFTKLYQIDLTGLSTNEEYLEAIRSFVEAHPDEEGYIGSPFMLNAYQLPNGSNPGPSKEDTEQLANPRTQAPATLRSLVPQSRGGQSMRLRSPYRHCGNMQTRSIPKRLLTHPGLTLPAPGWARSPKSTSLSNFYFSALYYRRENQVLT